MLDKEEIVGIDNRIGVVEGRYSSRGTLDLGHECLPLDAMARQMNDRTQSGRSFSRTVGGQASSTDADGTLNRRAGATASVVGTG